jgi:3-methylfumaryl-CoA hydratase
VADLVVHGPMTSTKLVYLLNNQLLLENPKAHIDSFTYRATSPLYVSRDIALQGKWTQGDSKNGGEVDLWATDDRGVLSMSGKAKVIA